MNARVDINIDIGPFQPSEMLCTYLSFVMGMFMNLSRLLDKELHNYSNQTLFFFGFAPEPLILLLPNVHQMNKWKGNVRYASVHYRMLA